MKLKSARVQHIGRLTGTSIKLDQKLIAIVGPNEAGKSTLLKALASSTNAEPLSMSERSRAATVADGSVFVTLNYRLGPEDVAALEDLNLETNVTDLAVHKRVDGAFHIFMKPRPRNARAGLSEPVRMLSLVMSEAESIRHRAMTDEDGVEVEETDAEREERIALASELTTLAQDLEAFVAEPEYPAESAHELVQRTATARASLVKYDSPDGVSESLRLIGDWFEIPDPKEEAQRRLLARTPDIASFEDKDRALESAYTLDANLIAAVPPALDNLARLAQLDLAALVAAVEAGQISVRNTLKNKANVRLKEHFSTVWNQSNLTVELNVENKTLRIGLVEDDVFASVLHERSQGLRAFVALSAFLAARDTGRPTILLIDEAENHLHINAQADLVEMFAEQDQAEKVIYTTHSPACLPSDLGIGIRAVVVDGEETSHVENSFWSQRGPALTSLMMAMGASAAAFTPARCVVVAEGASDMILLPSLLRLATGLRRLPYQVAPGLSELPKDLYPDLDFEASRVAYLVDGDQGGRQLTRAVGRKVPKELIVNLGVPGIENLLNADQYASLVVECIRDSAGAWEPRGAPAFPDRAAGSWCDALSHWLTSEGMTPPSKVSVAALATESDHLALDDDAAELLRGVHADICSALGIKSDSEAAVRA